MLNSQAIAPRPRIDTATVKEATTQAEAKPGVTRAEILELFQRDFAAMNRKVANHARL